MFSEQVGERPNAELYLEGDSEVLRKFLHSKREVGSAAASRISNEVDVQGMSFLERLPLTNGELRLLLKQWQQEPLGIRALRSRRREGHGGRHAQI